MKLYHYWRSSCSWRLRWALFYKGIEFQTTAIDLLLGEHKAKDFLAKNPLGFVPVLELGDGTIMTESWSILEWLEESFPSPSLLPADPPTRQRVRALSSIIFSATQPLQNPSVFKFHASEKEQQNRWARHFITEGLKAYSENRKTWNVDGDFYVGHQLSIADLCLIPQLYNARRFEIDLSQFPDLLEVENACKKSAGYEKAHPDSFKP